MDGLRSFLRLLFAAMLLHSCLSGGFGKMHHDIGYCLCTVREKMKTKV